jgi:hypothetical protein
MRDKFLERLLDDQRILEEIEDLLDFATVADRRNEPTRPIEDVLAQLEARGMSCTSI